MSRFSQAVLSRGSVVIIALSLIVLALIVLMGILPDRKEKDRLLAEAEILKAGLEKQRILNPLFISIRDRLDHKTGLEITLEDMDLKFGPGNIDNAPELLSAMALSAGMDWHDFFPVPESLAGRPGAMKLEGSLIGEYLAFREFLLKLASWESFIRLELLEVRSREGFPEYIVHVWMSIG